ncbi:MAG: hypothetical protein ACTHQ3_12685 [Motilibacteraceae bacterium]
MSEGGQERRLAEALAPLLVAQSAGRRGPARRAAHRALLAALGDDPGGELVRRLLEDPDPGVRSLLADATGSDTVLTALLDDEDQSVLEAVSARLLHMLSGEDDEPERTDSTETDVDEARPQQEDWGA